MATLPLGAAKYKTEFAVVNCPWKPWPEQRAGRGTKKAEMYTCLSFLHIFPQLRIKTFTDLLQIRLYFRNLLENMHLT